MDAEEKAAAVFTIARGVIVNGDGSRQPVQGLRVEIEDWRADIDWETEPRMLPTPRDRATGRPRRGAPPDPQVLARDALVAEYLEQHGPTTRNALGKALGINVKLVWLSLDRLRNRGVIRKCAGVGSETLWSFGPEACP